MEKIFYTLLVILTTFFFWINSDIAQRVSAGSQKVIKEESTESEKEIGFIEESKEVIIETGIELNTENVKVDYKLDEELDLSGLQVSLVFSNDEKRELSTEDYEINEVDMSSYGRKEVIVTYKEFTQSFDIEVSFSVTDTELKIMYSKTSLNIRKGPSTDFDKVGCFNINDEIKITGVCDNGWSRVDYNGQEVYVSTKYLSDKKIEIVRTSPSDAVDTDSVAAEMASRAGMIGRLTVPSLGINVALFNSYSQSTVDNKDSAGTYTYHGGQMIIADHKNQGFSAMKSSVPGKTIAYINNGKTVQAYICTAINIGSNTANGVPNDLLDCNGYSLYLQNAGSFCMYTCNAHWSSITYTFWQPI